MRFLMKKKNTDIELHCWKFMYQIQYKDTKIYIDIIHNLFIKCSLTCKKILKKQLILTSELWIT